MITDAQLVFSDGQAIAGVDVASTNVIDTGEARDLGRSATPVRLVVLVTEAFAGGTDLSVQLEQDTTDAFGSPTDVFVTPAPIPLASLTLGAKIVDVVLPNRAVAERYLRLFYDVTGVFTAGKVWAGLVLNVEGGELRLGHTGL